MDYPLLERKMLFVKEHINKLPKSALDNYTGSFEVEYTHNSTAIEGNTLTLLETKLLLDDKLSIGGKQLREIYEVVNHNAAFAYVNKRIAEGLPLDEKAVKDIHAILMDNIMVGGIYRNVDVYISGAQHIPPSPNEMYKQIKQFYIDLENKSDINPIELAAWTHAEFVKIHPFTDGNGRTSRLLMNYQFLANGYLPVSIPKEARLNYYECLECYALKSDLSQLTGLIYELEDKRLDFYINAIEQGLSIFFD
ncbi:Fic family protein [Eubacteriales bacterium OttesenSCG-928-G02]|nr:Fic family protein [Eubacteriales bacterium OttesenSCG-928-G02]